MRLERLTLAPYGRFADRVLNFRPDAALHVVLGANESGKTTALSAIGDLLFGFPGATPYGFAHDQRLLRVGGVFRLRDGSLLELRRRKGNKNTLVDASDQPVSEDALLSALGAVDRKTFESEFGLTARALREGGEALLRAGGGLAETLAASSAGLSALSKLRQTLSEEADALFTTRKSAGKPFYVALERHENADRRLRDAVVTADALRSAEALVLSAQSHEVDLKVLHEETGRVLARWRRAQRTGAKLARVDALARELAEFADLPPVAERNLLQWRAALDDETRLRADLDRLAAEEATDEAMIGALRVDPALLDQGEAIDALREKLGAVRKAADDLPRRVEAHHAAQAQLDDLARRLGLADHTALLEASPPDAAFARAKALIDARRRAEERHAEALARLETARAARESLRAVSGGEAIDPEPLKRRLATVAEVAAESERVRRERAACDAEARGIAEEVARLVPSAGDVESLARAPIPDGEALAHHIRADKEAADAMRAAKAKLAAAGREVEAAEATLARRTSDAKGATRADWMAARDRREEGFDRLAEALDGDARERRGRFDAVRAHALAADATAELAFSDVERAARVQEAREALAARRDDLSRAEAEAKVVSAAGERVRADGIALWAPSGIAPAEPVAMERWREKVAALLARRADLNRRRAEIDATGAKIEDARATLVGWLAEAGVATVPQTFDEANRSARAHLEALQAAWMKSRENEIALKRAERDTAEAEAAAIREASAREAQDAQWPAAMAGIRLAGSMGLEEAEAALKVWDAVALPRQTLAREARSIEGIEADIAEFEAGVATAVVAAPALARGTASETLARLVEALREARRAAEARDRLRKAMAQRAVTRQGLDARRSALDETLSEAHAALGAPDLSALVTTLDRLDRRRLREDECAGQHRDLLEIADGLDEAALRTERADLDFALLPGEIELALQTQSGLLHEIAEAGAASRDAKAKVDALSLGRDAAGAARDREEAAGELIDIAECWILRQAAARLAARAIERHRAAAQDPLVARAGEMFALASDGAFTGLGADYDDADRPVLIARRTVGERVRVEGLSEGARDQLFLSLRLALLERRAGEPLPFIGDDILASFDDERTLSTLRLLAQTAKGRQSIIFTHHRHVADLAESALSAEVDIVRLAT